MITMEIGLEDLRHFSNESMAWKFEPGIYAFMTGPSSDESDMLERVFAPQ